MPRFVLLPLLLLLTLPGGPDASSRPEPPTIHRDAWGVPHVFGPTDASVLYGAAWVQAEADWPLVEENFVRALGRGAELRGEDAVGEDYLARALEIPRLAKEEYARESPRMKALLDAYAAGFDAYLAAHPGERRLLDHVEPWYTLALLRFKYDELEFLGYAGLERTMVKALLDRGWPVGAGASPAVTPAAGTGGPRPAPGVRLVEDVHGPLGDIPLGSNEWALGPSRTADGHAMLLVNPHQSFFGVERYVEIHLHSDEGLVFSGLTRYGFLLPYMGNNARLGWTYTDNYADIGDLYVEVFDDPARPLSYRYGDGRETATTWSETERVKVGDSLESRTLRFWKTRHGPVVGLDGEGRPLAVRLAKLEEGGWFDQLDAMIRSRSLDEFREAEARLAVPYMNLMYADADGNIWYVYNSAVPRRDPAFDWGKPVDGSDPRTEWHGYHPLSDLPQVLNPPSGWLANTNSSPMSVTDPAPFRRGDFPPYMIGAETANARAASSRRLLAGLHDVTFDEFARDVWDTRLSTADSLVPAIRAEWDSLDPADPLRAATADAVRRLAAWDRTADVESVETTWFVLAVERWVQDRRAGKTRPAPWVGALAETLEALRDEWGRPDVAWGEVNRLQRPPSDDADDFADSLSSLPVGGAPSGLGSVFAFGTVPFGDVGRRYGVFGNSFVKAIEFGPVPRAGSVVVFGQSADPASAHFFDQAPLYAKRRFKPAWFTRADVEANATESYRPGP